MNCVGRESELLCAVELERAGATDLLCDAVDVCLRVQQALGQHADGIQSSAERVPLCKWWWESGARCGKERKRAGNGKERWTRAR